MTSENSVHKVECAVQAKSLTLPSIIEWELFRESMGSINETLRLAVNLAAGLMAGCITLFNILPSPVRHTFLDSVDNYVFLPVLVSIAFAYRGLSYHWDYDKKKGPPPEQVGELYKILSFKHQMLHTASILLSISAVLLAVCVLLEFS